MKNILKVLTIAALLLTLSSCNDYWENLVDDGTIESHINGGIVGDDGVHRFILCGVPYIIDNTTEFNMSQDICEVVLSANAPYDEVVKWSVHRDSSNTIPIWTTTNDTVQVEPDGYNYYIEYDYLWGNNNPGRASLTIRKED